MVTINEILLTSCEYPVLLCMVCLLIGMIVYSIVEFLYYALTYKAEEIRVNTAQKEQEVLREWVRQAEYESVHQAVKAHIFLDRAPKVETGAEYKKDRWQALKVRVLAPNWKDSLLN